MADSTVLVLAAGAYLVAISSMIAIADIRRMIIPNGLNAALACGALAYAALLEPAAVVSSFIGGSVGFSALLAFKSVYRSAKGREGLGYGDVKFVAGAGMWVGWQGLAPVMFISSLAALAFMAGRGALTGRIDPLQKLPFGPFLCAGTLTIWLVQAAGFASWVSAP